MATKKKAGKRGMSTATAVEIGAGVLAAATAAGAGYYFYADKHAKKHRKAASKWAKDMKTQVVKEAKKLKRLDQKAMARVVDEAAAMYAGVRSIDRKDLRQAAGELKRNWEAVKHEVAGGARRVQSAAKRSAKQTSKKVVTAKKAAKKTVTKTAKKAAPKRAKKAAKRSR